MKLLSLSVLVLSDCVLIPLLYLLCPLLICSFIITMIARYLLEVGIELARMRVK